MNRRVALVLALFAVHSVVTDFALYRVGYWEIFRVAWTDWASAQIFSDLSVSLVLISVWMLRDARQRGANAWPFVLAMIPLGSFAWMGYLLAREWRAPVPAVAP
jgi:hypothetical protein